MWIRTISEKRPRQMLDGKETNRHCQKVPVKLHRIELQVSANKRWVRLSFIKVPVSVPLLNLNDR